MWAVIIFTVLFLIFVVLAISAFWGDVLFGAAVFCILAIACYILALLSAGVAGNEALRIKERFHYYEVIATASVPGKGTLVYVIDLESNEGKADILAEYPMKGCKIEQIGKRTFLLPVNTTVTTDDKGKILLVSEDGVVVSLKTEGPVNPPLGGPVTD